jgi:hypothetical protein
MVPEIESPYATRIIASRQNRVRPTYCMNEVGVLHNPRGFRKLIFCLQVQRDRDDGSSISSQGCSNRRRHPLACAASISLPANSRILRSHLASIWILITPTSRIGRRSKASTPAGTTPSKIRGRQNWLHGLTVCSAETLLTTRAPDSSREPSTRGERRMLSATKPCP